VDLHERVKYILAEYQSEEFQINWVEMKC